MKTNQLTTARWISGGLLLAIFVLLAILPQINHGYTVTLLTDILRYAILTVAWMIFSGPTNYMSLATAAFTAD